MAKKENRITLTVRLDPEHKKKFDILCTQLDISMQDALYSYVLKAINSNKL